MSNLDFTLICIIKFFSKKRKTPPNLSNGNYYPHLVIKGDTEYLGVCFIDGEEVIFDKEIIASALPLYEGVDYSGLTKGTEFMIMEGGNKVGEGVIDEIFQHIPAKEFRK
jgi:hypothetical protein